MQALLGRRDASEHGSPLAVEAEPLHEQAAEKADHETVDREAQGEGARGAAHRRTAVMARARAAISVSPRAAKASAAR